VNFNTTPKKDGGEKAEISWGVSVSGEEEIWVLGK